LLEPGLEDKKDVIAEMAAGVFGQKGYNASSLQDAARQAGIGKAGLYHYFKSKEDILFYISHLNAPKPRK
jgi:TetR/AcrR family transcriptional regulator, cholesterol catabolism regulator